MSRTKTKYPGILFDDQRAQKPYYATFNYGKDENGKRTRKVKAYKTLKEAKDDLDVFRGKMANKLVPFPTEMTLAELLDIWYEDKKSYDEETSLYNYKNIIERHIKPILGEILIQNITAKHLNQYFVLKAKKRREDTDGLAYTTMERHREVVRKCLQVRNTGTKIKV